MTGLLASVRTLDEAALALEAGADLIDLKEPAAGALGALPAGLVREAVALIAGRRATSATTGDLPMTAGPLRDAAAAMAATGIDYVKVGLFPGGEPAACLAALGELAEGGVRLVAVLFADPALVETLARRGFAGAMLDTAGKAEGSLRQCLGEAEIGRFVARTRGAGLLVGLAGSLGPGDIAPLLRLKPDYLGFRGALCVGGRSGTLSAARLAAVRAAIPGKSRHGSSPMTHGSRSGAARATRLNGACP